MERLQRYYRIVLLTTAIVINILVIGFFKYSGFLIENINYIFNCSLIIPNIPLPIGISFFTFQAMSYVIDVYRHDGVAQRNVLNVALYIALFPQLIAGPIVRYQTIADQIDNRCENIQDISDGCCRFVLGLGKKVILSNTMALVADYAFNNNGILSIATAWLGAVAYFLQIYLDFSGYSDMAIGLGKMFGFRFLENFNYPYIANSITDFWRRWHISLSSWFRDYLYIPMGGNRNGKVRQVLNLGVVWFLTGLWHGANWTFILWGMYYFILLIIEKFFLLKYLNRYKWFGHFITVILVIIGWVLFRSESITEAFIYLKAMFGVQYNTIYDYGFLQYIIYFSLFFVVSVIACLPVKIIFVKCIKKRKRIENFKYIYSILVFVLCLIFLAADSYNPFIYFNF